MNKIEAYIRAGGKILIFKGIDFFRDGGTPVIKTDEGEFFVNKKLFTIHTAYPPSPENAIADEGLVEYLIEMLTKHLQRERDELHRVGSLIENIKSAAQ